MKSELQTLQESLDRYRKIKYLKKTMASLESIDPSTKEMLEITSQILSINISLEDNETSTNEKLITVDDELVNAAIRTTDDMCKSLEELLASKQNQERCLGRIVRKFKDGEPDDVISIGYQTLQTLVPLSDTAVCDNVLRKAIEDSRSELKVLRDLSDMSMTTLNFITETLRSVMNSLDNANMHLLNDEEKIAEYEKHVESLKNVVDQVQFMVTNDIQGNKDFKKRYGDIKDNLLLPASANVEYANMCPLASKKVTCVVIDQDDDKSHIPELHLVVRDQVNNDETVPELPVSFYQELSVELSDYGSELFLFIEDLCVSIKLLKHQLVTTLKTIIRAQDSALDAGIAIFNNDLDMLVKILDTIMETKLSTVYIVQERTVGVALSLAVFSDLITDNDL